MGKIQTVEVTRDDAIAFRFRRHQLHQPPDTLDPGEIQLLDLGVQDTGTFGSAWALADVRGAKVKPGEFPADLFLAWTTRGAPHAYRRADAKAVMVATAPFSEEDTSKRIFDAAKKLHDTKIPALDGLRTVAEEMRDLAAKPIVKGDMSSALTERLDEPFLRYCTVCDATHSYEQSFRYSSLQAGLELEPGTSPPVLRRIPRIRPLAFTKSGAATDEQHDVIRGYLRFFGPASARMIASYADSLLKDIKANLPDHLVEVGVSGVTGKDALFVLAEDVDELEGAAEAPPHDGPVVRLVGSHDPWLQGKDRELLVKDKAKQKALWPTIGRPGAVLIDGEVVALWRPRTKGKALGLELDPWTKLTKANRSSIADEAERLAAHRQLTLGQISDA